MLDLNSQIQNVTKDIGEALSADVEKLVLDLRARAQENTLSMLGSEPGAPTLARHWKVSVGSLPKVGKLSSLGEAGEAEARAELAKRKPGEGVFVYNDLYYGYFHEYGYTHSNGTTKPAVGFLRAAVEAIGNG